AKHVWVDREWHLGGLANALDEAVEVDGADGPAALGNEDVSLFRVVAAYAAPSSRRPGWDAHWECRSLPGERARGLRITRSAAIAGRRPPRLAGRGGRRPGSWLRRDARSGHACARSP